MVEPIPYLYTTVAEMNRLFSTVGVTLLADDSENGIVEAGEAEAIDDAINEATDYLNMTLLQFYEDYHLADSPLVRRWATAYACFFFSQRRGNPSKFNKLIARIEESLEAIQVGQKQIPRLPTRSTFAPSVTNHVINDRFRIHKARVKQSLSTSEHYAGRDEDYEFLDFGP